MLNAVKRQPGTTVGSDFWCRAAECGVAGGRSTARLGLKLLIPLFNLNFYKIPGES